MKDGITWVGLDAHKKAINVAMRLPGRKQFVEWTVENEPRAVKRLARKLVREAGGTEVRVCYEAGPCGYALKRQLEAAASLTCEVVAPTLIPRKPGERVKTDRRDARKLCELLEAGLLTEVKPPTEEQERARDLSRCRNDLREDMMRARHRISKFLLRRAVRYTAGKKAWTTTHMAWLRALRFDDAVDQVVFADYLLALSHCEERLKSIDAHLEKLASEEPYREPVGWLRCFRGIDTVTAMGIVTELYDLRRFASPRALMNFIGITPSEHSSGDKKSRGGITKAGNEHVRRLVIEAAHHYRHRPAVGLRLRKRREGQPPELIAIADKAQQRLYRRHHHLSWRGVQANKVTVALARELVGFVWAALMHKEAA